MQYCVTMREGASMVDTGEVGHEYPQPTVIPLVAGAAAAGDGG